MRITVNGQSEEAPDGLTIAALLEGRGLAPARVAVEVNETLVPRKDYDQTLLQPHDLVEIVTFVGGG